MISKQNLSHANKLHWGRGRDRMLVKEDRTAGAEVMLLTLVDFGTPALGDADFLVKAATGTQIPDAAETVTYTTATDGTAPLDSAAPTPVTIVLPDGSSASVWDVSDGAEYGRNLVSVATHTTDVVAMTVLISGYDYLKRAMSELHTFAAAGTNTTMTVTGAKAFKYVRSVAITAAADASANTLNIGTGAKLGLRYALQKIGHCIQASIAGVQEQINVASNATVVAAVSTTATNATGDVRGTVTFNAALDGTKRPMCVMWVEETASAVGLLGVTQA